MASTLKKMETIEFKKWKMLGIVGLLDICYWSFSRVFGNCLSGTNVKSSFSQLFIHFSDIMYEGTISLFFSYCSKWQTSGDKGEFF